MEFVHDTASNDAGLTIFRVGAHTVPIALAEAVAKILRQQDALEIQAMGAAAVYRATQALCIARVLLENDQIDLGFTPMFGEATVDGETFVGLILEVEYRPCTGVPPIRINQR